VQCEGGDEVTFRVYPIGYSVLGARERIDELLQNEKTLLIDTRITPWSWNDEWKGQALKARYGDKYKFEGKYLGNLEKDRGFIKIADMNAGMDELMRYFDKGHELILLCQCKKYDTCHVSHIVDQLLQLLIVEVVRFEGVQKPKRNTLDEDVAELKELREVFEPDRMIICQRSGPGKGCTMTWAPGDKVWAKINGQDVQAVVREVTGSIKQIVKLRTAVYSPLADKLITSNDPRDFDGSKLKPRLTYVKEFGESE
jgi:hypothetical protein